MSGDVLAGRERLGEGREAEVYAWDDGLALRLFRGPESEERLEREVAAMRAATSCGVPVPRLDGSLTVDGRPGLLVERVDGPDLITLFGRRPWSAPRLIRECGVLHARMHEAVVSSGLEDLRGSLRARIARVPSSVLPTELAAYALEQLDALPDGDRLCHGDFHPGNVLLGADGPRVIDWTNATRGDPMADVARTCLMLTVGAPEPSMPALVHRLSNLGRSVIVRRYLRAYRQRRPFDAALVRRWQVVRAADRLFEDIGGEREQLVTILAHAVSAPD